MVSVKKTAKLNLAQFFVGLIPTIFSILFLIVRSNLLLIFCVLSLFIVVGTVPLFKKRENLWMFVLAAISGAPVNLYLSYLLLLKYFVDSYSLVGCVLWDILLNCVLFSVEEIVFGIVTRCIWKTQYKIIID